MDTENQLIESYKKDFSLKIGKLIEIKVLDKWEELCFFDREAPFWTVVAMILDATGWESSRTFAKMQSREPVSRRQIIDLISMCNGGKLVHIGRETNRDHTTVLHSVANSKDFIEKDMLYRKFVREIMDYIRKNYTHYSDKVYTRDMYIKD